MAGSIPLVEWAADESTKDDMQMGTLCRSARKRLVEYAKKPRRAVEVEALGERVD